jgi:16S rRNA G966 N2-methylase RsmD
MFPKGYEERMWRLLGKPNPNSILHVFGGRAKIGARIDINPAVNPDYIMDAHDLDFHDESFNVVICDPPFSDIDNKNKYQNTNARSLDMMRWKSEASRVCKPSGFIVIRHFWETEAPPNCEAWMNIILQQCSGRHIHMVQIFMKGE